MGKFTSGQVDPWQKKGSGHNAVVLTNHRNFENPLRSIVLGAASGSQLVPLVFPSSHVGVDATRGSEDQRSLTVEIFWDHFGVKEHDPAIFTLRAVIPARSKPIGRYRAIFTAEITARRAGVVVIEVSTQTPFKVLFARDELSHIMEHLRNSKSTH